MFRNILKRKFLSRDPLFLFDIVIEKKEIWAFLNKFINQNELAIPWIKKKIKASFYEEIF